MERLGVLVGCLESILGVFAASWARLGASSWDPLSPSWPVSEWAGAVSGALGAHPQPVYFWLWMGRFLMVAVVVIMTLVVVLAATVDDEDDDG